MNQKNIVIKTYRGLPEEARDIREEVFVEEQKFIRKSIAIILRCENIYNVPVFWVRKDKGFE